LIEGGLQWNSTGGAGATVVKETDFPITAFERHPAAGKILKDIPDEIRVADAGIKHHRSTSQIAEGVPLKEKVRCVLNMHGTRNWRHFVYVFA
jgi:hypothetical protein